MIKLKKDFKILLIIITSFILIINLCLAQNKQSKAILGFYSPDINSSGSIVKESFSQWVEEIRKLSTYKPFKTLIVEPHFYNTPDELYKDVYNNSLDIINISSWDYYKLKFTNRLKPILVASSNEKEKKERFYLIKHISNPVENVEQLINQKIVLPKFNSVQLAKSWLQVELYDKLGKKKYRTIKIVESRNNDNYELYSVFFKRIDYAVIRESSYLTAAELNPQLRKQISILAKSSGYIYYFAAARRNFDEELCNEIKKVGMNLHTSVAGKQILNLMRGARIFPISEEDLRESKELFNKYNIIFNNY
ncbi:MAG: PhnD/SsuA/transferrin family substrate-binding protein [Melioribacter sp.]|uniref:PhnD/SsuA/transferrin family substrate-binding protein n=1 Tax=Rosettibacter primus TaxID=3111523 RepID=UPI00247E9E5D|nr:PhnD/SsuA/transferrin family substrate-binding protein [Melioribacter sp.]